MAKFIVRKIAKEDIEWGTGTFTVNGQTFTRIDASSIPWIDGNSSVADVINNKADIDHNHTVSDISDFNTQVDNKISDHNSDTNSHTDIRNALNNKADLNHTHSWTQVSKSGSKLSDIEDVPDYNAVSGEWYFKVVNGSIVLDEVSDITDTFKIKINQDDSSPDYLINKVSSNDFRIDSGGKLALNTLVARYDNSEKKFNASVVGTNTLSSLQNLRDFFSGTGYNYQFGSDLVTAVRKLGDTIYPIDMDYIFGITSLTYFVFKTAVYSQTVGIDLINNTQASNFTVDTTPGEDYNLVMKPANGAITIDIPDIPQNGIIVTFKAIEASNETELINVNNEVKILANGRDLIVDIHGQRVTFNEVVRDKFWYTLFIEKENNNCVISLDYEGLEQTVSISGDLITGGNMTSNVDVGLFITLENGIRNLMKAKLQHSRILSKHYGRIVENITYMA